MPCSIALQNSTIESPAAEQLPKGIYLVQHLGRAVPIDIQGFHGLFDGEWILLLVRNDGQNGVLIPLFLLKHVLDPLINDEIWDGAKYRSNLLDATREGLEQFLLDPLVVAHVVERNTLGDGTALNTALPLL